MTANQARLENDLPSVVEANDLDAQTAENLRSSTFSNATKLVGEVDNTGTAARNSDNLLYRMEIEGIHTPKDIGNGFWKSPEKTVESLFDKCFHNSWENRQQDAKEKLGGHIDNLVGKEHSERMKGLHEALIEGNIKGISESIGNIPPHLLMDYLKDINQHLKDSDSDVRMTVTSRGNVLMYSKDNSSAVEVDPRTGEARERAIVGMTKSIPPQLVFGDVEPGDPKEALGRIGDEVTKDLTFGKEDIKPLPFEPIKPRWDWDEPPNWHRPGRRPFEEPHLRPMWKYDESPDRIRKLFEQRFEAQPYGYEK